MREKAAKLWNFGRKFPLNLNFVYKNAGVFVTEPLGDALSQSAFSGLSYAVPCPRSAGFLVLPDFASVQRPVEQKRNDDEHSADQIHRREAGPARDGA